MLHKRRIKMVELLISQGYVTEKQMIKVLEEQKKSGREVASLIVDMGYMTHNELTAVLGEQINLTQRKRLGEVLVDHALITPEQLNEALEMQRSSHESIGQCLLKLHYIDESTILDVLGAQLDTTHVVLDNIVFNHKMFDLVPMAYIEEYKVIPLFLHGDQLTIAMADPTNLRTRDHLRFTTGKEIDPVIASEASIDEFIRRLKNNEVKEVNAPLDTMEKITLDELEEQQRSERSEYGEVVVNIVNNLVLEAIDSDASDIHIDVVNNKIRVRFRIDGVLVVRRELDFQYQAPIISRLKILSGLDIAEKRKPQDGKFHIVNNGHQVDIRVSTFPMISSDRGLVEKAVLRILDSSSGNFTLDEIGFSESLREQYEEILGSSNGIILVTGPTGSGKSTTLYASLQQLHSPEVNIITMEDPVEYTIEGIAQGQIHPKSGFTFATGLRSILRQDPDIIMVGEMRDEETCKLAIQAALTGHLVFSTLHTNDAPSAITRLIDMNIEPYLISSSVKGILAQRLVRRICPHCKEEYTAPQVSTDHFSYTLPEKLYRGKGCPYCNHTGFKGRIPIFELLILDEKVEELILQKATASEIRSYAIAEMGMETLRYNGFKLVESGETTLEEVLMKTEADSVTVQEPTA